LPRSPRAPPTHCCLSAACDEPVTTSFRTVDGTAKLLEAFGLGTILNDD
jgi:hypothetical protein